MKVIVYIAAKSHRKSGKAGGWSALVKLKNRDLLLTGQSPDRRIASLQVLAVMALKPVVEENNITHLELFMKESGLKKKYRASGFSFEGLDADGAMSLMIYWLNDEEVDSNYLIAEKAISQ